MYDHEQSRPDRADHVVIKWANIEDGQAHNFLRTRWEGSADPPCHFPLEQGQSYEDCYNWDEALDQGFPYDFQSIMHYSAWG